MRHCVECGAEKRATQMYRVERANGHVDFYCTKRCMRSTLFCGACGHEHTAERPVKLIRIHGKVYRAICEGSRHCFIEYGMIECRTCGEFFDIYQRDSQGWNDAITRRPDVCSEECLHAIDAWPFEQCERCGIYITPRSHGGNRHMTAVDADGNTHSFCGGSCMHEGGYLHCGRCGNGHARENMVAISYSASDESFYCETCAQLYVQNEEVWHCEHCNGYHYVNDNDRCVHIVHGVTNYTYKPRPLFRRVAGESGVCAGIEVEVDHVRYTERDSFCQDTATRLAESTGGWLYCKHDRTAQAFEVVSHPFTWEWYKKNPRMFGHITNLRRMGYSSYNGGNCGIHVHMSKDAFTNMHLYKFMRFIYMPENQAFVLALSQRVPQRLREWARTDNKNESMMLAESISKRGNGDRHSAVNITGATVELRIFRGTLKPVSFEKNIEFCFALYEFTKRASRQNLGFWNFVEFVAKEGGKYANLASFINESERIMSMLSERSHVLADDEPIREQVILESFDDCDCPICVEARESVRASMPRRTSTNLTMEQVEDIWNRLDDVEMRRRRSHSTI